jgi:hypothetical protein
VTEKGIPLGPRSSVLWRIFPKMRFCLVVANSALIKQKQKTKKKNDDN